MNKQHNKIYKFFLYQILLIKVTICNWKVFFFKIAPFLGFSKKPSSIHREPRAEAFFFVVNSLLGRK